MANITDKNKDRFRVILIDDEQGFTDVLAKRLGKRQIFAKQCSSGTDAIRELRENRFDVAVLDLKMEDMDGLEVLKILKIIDPVMPVIMLTGHGSYEAAQKGMAMGAYAYLSKPCEFEELHNQILKAHQANNRRQPQTNPDESSSQ